MFAKPEEMHWPAEATPVVTRLLLAALPVWLVLCWLQPGLQHPRVNVDRLELARAELQSLARAAAAFRARHGRLPAIDELCRPDGDGRVWTVAEEQDPWGGRYQLGSAPGGALEVRTPGPDGAPGTGDDLRVALPATDRGGTAEDR